MPCSTDNCKELPVFRYTWAGRNEARCCIDCGAYLDKVAGAMGYYVQLIPLTPSEIKEEMPSRTPIEK